MGFKEAGLGRECCFGRTFAIDFLKLGFFDKKLNRVKIVSESNFLRNFDQNLICGDSTAAAKIAYLYI